MSSGLYSLPRRYSGSGVITLKSAERKLYNVLSEMLRLVQTDGPRV